MKKEIKDFLLEVQKPGRYTGEETGSVFKNKEETDTRIAFCFPDVYEIGMSNLGMKILYGVLNKVPGVWCERVYAPWPDMEEKMREKGVRLFTCESGDDISDFDIIAFTLQYELCYTNVLNMLSLASVPLRSSDRGDSDPIVIAGGPCAYNAEPMADFIDIFSIGEGEDALPELASLYQKMKKEGSYTKEKFLYAAATSLEGFYVPSLYDVSYNPDGTIKAIIPKDGVPEKVTKRIVSDINSAYVPIDAPLPNIETVHDRVTLEVFRGCIRGCRFCQAGFISRPVREKSPEVLCDQAKAYCAATGYEEISLSSLSISDYSLVNNLTDRLLEWTNDEKINLSLPSLRADSFTKELMDKISSVRTSTVTFAPEAGSQRLRDVINKNVTEEEILRASSVAYSAGKSKIKLYFMNGLPCETDEDIAGINDIAQHVVDEYYRTEDRNRAQQPQVTLSVACFIPKPQTPFQWDGQNTFEELDRKQKLLLSLIRNRKIKYNYHDAKVSFIEAVFARGDRRLSLALETAVRDGIKFDSWDEYFSFDRWMETFEKCGTDPSFYANRTISEDEILPWDMIDTGVDKSFLISERHKAYQAAVTPSCREKCSGCGANKLVDRKFCRWCPGHPEMKDESTYKENKILTGEKLLRERQKTNPEPVRSIRIIFEKSGPMLYISHLDLTKCMTRAIKKSGIPIWYTEGYNPIPHLVFSAPLSVGCKGEREILDIRITSPMTDGEIIRRLAESVPDGIYIKEVYTRNNKMKEIARAKYTIRCHFASDGSTAEGIKHMFDGSYFIEKKSKSGVKTCDISDMIEITDVVCDGDDTVITAFIDAGNEKYLKADVAADEIEMKFAPNGEKTGHDITRNFFTGPDGRSKFR